MQFRVTMKCPDTLSDAITEALDDGMRNGGVKGFAMDDDDDFDFARAAILAICEKWFKFGEAISVEIDTDARTCNVVENWQRT